jgi:hypothetical protein
VSLISLGRLLLALVTFPPSTVPSFTRFLQFIIYEKTISLIQLSFFFNRKRRDYFLLCNRTFSRSLSLLTPLHITPPFVPIFFIFHDLSQVVLIRWTNKRLMKVQLRKIILF